MGQMIHFIFLIYTLILGIRIIGSWFPDIAAHPYMATVGQITDPYLNLFRKIIPPIGGVLDLSPILAFLTLQFVESLLRSIFKN